MCAYIAAKCEDGVKVYLEDEIPIRIWELSCWMSGLYTGTVQEDVDFVFIGEDFGNEGRNGGLGGEV